KLERQAAAARRRRLLQIKRGAGRGARAPVEHRFLVEHAPPAGQLRAGRAQAAAFALALPAIPDQRAIAEDPHGLLRMVAVERNDGPPPDAGELRGGDRVGVRFFGARISARAPAPNSAVRWTRRRRRGRSRARSAAACWYDAAGSGSSGR